MSASIGVAAQRNRRLAYLSTILRFGVVPDEAQTDAIAWDAFVAAAPNEDEADARDTLVSARLARGYNYAAFNSDYADGLALAATWACASSAEPVDPPVEPPAEPGA